MKKGQMNELAQMGHRQHIPTSSHSGRSITKQILNFKICINIIDFENPLTTILDSFRLQHLR